MKLLLFVLFSFSSIAQERNNFVYDDFTITIIAENNTLNVFARNTSLRDLRIEMLNPKGKRVHKVIVPIKESYRFIVNFSDGVNGYYNIRAKHKRVFYMHYYVKMNSINDGIFANNISFLLSCQSIKQLLSYQP
jgi:hypothetical protein